MRTSTLRLSVAGLAAASMLSMTACGSDSLDDKKTAGASSGAAKDTSCGGDVTTASGSAASLVPSDIKSKGTLTIGTDASYAPNEFTAEDGKTIQGMDVDLLSAAAAKMGLKVTFQNGNFDTLIGGVTAGKYPAAISSFTINCERMKTVTMVKYFNAGTLWATTKGDPKKVNPDDACGLTVGVQKGTVQVDDLTARSKKCTDAGKKAITQVVEVEQSKVTADLMAGKVDAFAADSPVGSWAVAKNADKLQKVGSIYDAAPYGVVVPKDQTKFAQAIAAAFSEMEKDGTYKKILAKWNNTDGAVSDFAANPKTSSGS